MTRAKRIDTASKSSLPPCPDLEDQPHPLKAWRALSGQGDAVEDPYPEKVR